MKFLQLAIKKKNLEFLPRDKETNHGGNTFGLQSKALGIKYSISCIPHSAEWNTFVKIHPQGNYFQSLSYFNFQQSLKNSKPEIVYVRNNQNEIEGLLLAVFQFNKDDTCVQNVARCIIYGGPLVSESEYSLEIYQLLFEGLFSLPDINCSYYEIRNLHLQEINKSIFLECGFVFQEHLNILVDLQSANNAMQSIRDSKMRQVEQSIKNGAEVIEDVTIKQLKEFYAILQNLYTRKVKKKLPDWEFFEAFYFQAKENNSGKYFLIQYQNKIIGGIMCPFYRNVVLYEWYICGLDKEYKGVHPSILATYSAIKYAQENGFSTFDFMGAGKPDITYGVRDFKKQFGGELVNYGRFVYRKEN